MLAAKDGFQAGQTAKAPLGPPCAVTPPEKDVAANSDWNYPPIVSTSRLTVNPVAHVRTWGLSPEPSCRTPFNELRAAAESQK